MEGRGGGGRPFSSRTSLPAQTGGKHEMVGSKSIILLFLYYYYFFFLQAITPLSTPLPLPILHSAVWYPGPSAQLVTADDKQLTLWKVKGDAAKVAVCTPSIKLKGQSITMSLVLVSAIASLQSSSGRAGPHRLLHSCVEPPPQLYPGALWCGHQCQGLGHQNKQVGRSCSCPT